MANNCIKQIHSAEPKTDTCFVQVLLFIRPTVLAVINSFATEKSENLFQRQFHMLMNLNRLKSGIVRRG